MDKKKIIIKIARVVAFSLVMCAVAVGLFYLYFKEMPEIIAALEEKGKMENTIEAVTHILPMLNIAGLIIALTLLYSPVRSSSVQDEKGWIMLIVAAFTYGVILPYVLKQSEGCFDPLPEGVEDVKSMLEITASWFVVQVIPFMIAMTYHFIRAGKKEEVQSTPVIENDEHAQIAEEQNEE
jgi:cbb3-type cytochrome oxidase subunit 3